MKNMTLIERAIEILIARIDVAEMLVMSPCQRLTKLLQRMGDSENIGEIACRVATSLDSRAVDFHHEGQAFAYKMYSRAANRLFSIYR